MGRPGCRILLEAPDVETLERMLEALRWPGLSPRAARVEGPFAPPAISLLDEQQPASSSAPAAPAATGPAPDQRAAKTRQPRPARRRPPPPRATRRTKARADKSAGDTPGDRVRAAREERGLSVADVALKLGITSDAVRMVERGRRPTMKSRAAARYAAALGVTADWLRFGTQAPAPETGPAPPPPPPPKARPRPARKPARTTPAPDPFGMAEGDDELEDDGAGRDGEPAPVTPEERERRRLARIPELQKKVAREQRAEVRRAPRGTVLGEAEAYAARLRGTP